MQSQHWMTDGFEHAPHLALASFVNYQFNGADAAAAADQLHLRRPGRPVFEADALA